MQLGIVTHDAGAAEILCALVKKKKFLSNLQGPAKKIFKKNFVKFNNIALQKLVLKCNKIICGTSFKSDLEKRVILLATKNKIKTISILDSGLYLKERYFLKNKLCKPNEIWVYDDFTYTLSRKFFNGGIKIKKKKNVYIYEVLKNFKNLKKKNKINILYLAGLMRNQSNVYNKIEKTHILNFLKWSKKLTDRIIVRFHTAESEINKNFLRKNYTFKESKSLLYQDLIDANIVLGTNTNALKISAKCNKKTYSILKEKYKKFLFHGSKIKFAKISNL